MKTVKKDLAIGDLVVFQSVSINVKRNQIGIVISTTVHSILEDDSFFNNVQWYVVQFGTMRLIVSDEMVKKIE